MNRCNDSFRSAGAAGCHRRAEGSSKRHQGGRQHHDEPAESPTFAGKELKPGDYAVSADETHVQLSMNGKVVAEAPVQWKDETSKAKYSTFVSQGNKITEIHFGGKTRFVTIAE